MARRAAERSAVTLRLMKEAINATAGALHRATCFADGDQSLLTGGFEAAPLTAPTAAVAPRVPCRRGGNGPIN